MKNRFFVFIILLIFRITLGWVSTAKYDVGRRVAVTGNINKLYQSGNKCIIEIGIFFVEAEKYCALESGAKITAIGSIDKQLIDSLLGKIWLRNGEIDEIDRTQELKESRTQEVTVIDNFRMFLVNIFRKNMPENESGLISGIVLGYKDDIGRKFYREMIDSGTVHIVVASGYNVLLVGGACLSILFWFVTRKYAATAAIAIMGFYAVLAGGDPPVVRAVWMAGLLYLSLLMGRKGQSAWILFLAAWVMLMIDPYLMTSASFQLSVAASFGLIVVEPWFSKKLERSAGDGLLAFMSGSGLTTTSATMMMTAPVLWWHFGRLSLIGILSNTLILPLVAPLMILGVAMLVLPGVFSLPVYGLAHLIVVVIKFFGS